MVSSEDITFMEEEGGTSKSEDKDKDKDYDGIGLPTSIAWISVASSSVASGTT